MKYLQVNSITFSNKFDTFTNMNGMFYGIQAITLDLSSFDTSSVIAMPILIIN